MNTDATGPTRNFTDTIWSNATVGAAGGTQTVASGDTLFFNTSAATSLTNDITGATYAGFTFNAGASAYTIGGNAFTLGGTILNNSTTLQTINSDISFTSSRSITASAGNILLGGSLSTTVGGAQFTKDGPATLTLAGASNSLAGVLQINGGTLDIGSGGITLSSGTRLIQTAASATVNATGGGTIKLNVASGDIGVSSGSGTLTINAAIQDGTFNNLDIFGLSTSGTVVLGGGNTHTGNTHLQQGFLRLANTLALQNSTLNTTPTGIASLTFDAAVAANAFTLGGLLGNGSFALQNDAAAAIALTIGNNNSSNTYSGALSGAGSLVKIGTGTQSLSGTNTYSGATTVSAGTLQAGSTSAFGSNSAVTLADVAGATLSLNNNSNSIGSLAGGGGSGGNVTLGAGTLTNGGNNASTSYAGAISGTGGLTKTGTGTQTLTSVSNYTGATTVNGGTLRLTGSLYNNGGSAGSLVVNNGGTLSLGRNDTFGNDVTNTAVTLTINQGGLVINSGVYNALPNVTLNGGELRSSGGFNGIYPAYQLRNVVVGGGGASLITTTGAANSSVALGRFAGDMVSFAVADATGNAGPDLTVSAPLQNSANGASGLTKSGTGTMVLSGANTYTGATTVSDGILQVDANNALGTLAGGTTVASGTTLRLNSVNYSTSEPLTINGTGFGGAGALASTGTSTYAGQITAATSATINTGGGTLTFTGGLVKSGTVLTLTGGGTVNVNTVGISGALANSDLIVDATTVNLNTANSYTGPTFIRNGSVLNANVAGALPTATRTAVTFDGTGTSTLTLGAGQQAASLTSALTTATVNLNGNSLTVGTASGTTTYAGTITGGGAGLTKEGASTQILSGANSYSAITNVTGGTLLINNTSGSGTGFAPVDVGAAGTLGGTGSIQNQATVNGTIAPGDPAINGGIESLVLTALTLNSGSVAAFQLQGISNYDQIVTNATTVNPGGTLSLSFLPGFVAAPGDFFKLIDAGSTVAPFTASNFGTPTDGQRFAGTGSAANYIFEYDYNGTNTAGFAGGDATSLSLLVVVPEPSRAVLLLLAGMGMMSGRRRKNA